MGPFKYECLNMKPEVGFLHDIINANQTSKMKNEAKKNMRSTPFGSGSYAGKVLKGPYEIFISHTGKRNIVSKKFGITNKCSLCLIH